LFRFLLVCHESEPNDPTGFVSAVPDWLRGVLGGRAPPWNEEAFNLFLHMTVLRNVTLAPRQVLKLSHSDAETCALELLEVSASRTRRASIRTGTREASSIESRSCARSPCNRT
jgi:hypothetical protein